MSPKALESWKHITVLCQFHLRLGIGGLGTHSEYVKDKTRSVEYLHLEFRFYVTKLFCRKFVIENHHTDLFPWSSVGMYVLVLHMVFAFLYVCAYLLKFSRSYIGYAAWTIHSLRESLQYLCAGCVGKKLKFVKIFGRFSLILVGSDEAYEYGSFCFSFRYYEFFHVGCKDTK